MVVLNRIYTRTGDDGTTALGSGERRPKYDLRVSAYGTVDETNAAIGVARLHLKGTAELDAMLSLVQNDLFDLGADLSVPQREGKAERLRMVSSQVARLEREVRLERKRADDLIYRAELDELAARGDGFETFFTLTREQPEDWQGYGRRVDGDMLAERIVQLGGEPDFEPTTLVERSHADYDASTDLQAMIRANLVAERVAIEAYSQMIRLIGDKDSTTRRILESILSQEQEHAEELSDWLTE